jgi:uncharacterized protein YneF (UPF0154 family)
VWHLADQLEQTGGFWGGVFSSAGSIVISVIILLATGLFVSFFIGDRIILSGLKHEKKIEEKTETEIREEETILINTAFRLERMEKDLSAIKKDLEERKMKQ